MYLHSRLSLDNTLLSRFGPPRLSVSRSLTFMVNVKEGEKKKKKKKSLVVNKEVGPEAASRRRRRWRTIIYHAAEP